MVKADRVSHSIDVDLVKKKSNTLSIFFMKEVWHLVEKNRPGVLLCYFNLVTVLECIYDNDGALTIARSLSLV